MQTITLRVAENGGSVPMTPEQVRIIEAVSPTVDVERVEGGLRITIHDLHGAHSAELGDGDDYVLTAEDKSEIADMAAELVSVPVQDVQINGTSILNQGVANVPIASNSLGVVKVISTYGVDIDSNGLLIAAQAQDNNIKNGNNSYKPITTIKQHMSVFYGLAKAAGDSTQSGSSNAVGTYTESAKSSIASMLNAPESVSGSTPSITAKAGVRYICGECSTLDITTPATGIIDVVFESGSTPTVLTVTPPTGMTMKWANGFDPTALEANTTYEINVMDGVYGVVGAWT